ncbi:MULTISPECIES: hypothetical protein [Atopobiaceae]|uniref:Uncharacterized protein n=1 Tax=Parafannyhessea umbonata TaxID=604330 RepID=A0A1H6J380_9ACTN|nr:MULTISPECIES: hypothetical protein [Atopobiaceae]SEH54680.1 hypothetical protein SAMN05216447_10571 [Parafannyhessea umbonata]SJZ45687.1 hypothetical protein SAMN06298223_0424 [Olsenella sp. KH1P3]
MNEIARRILVDQGLKPVEFEQPHVIDLIRKPISDVWTVVCTHNDKVFGTPAIFCCFANMEHKAQILEESNWLKHPDSFSPGFCMSAGSARFDSSSYDGFHFIVMEQYFHSLEEAQFHLNQEFALLFELYRDPSGNYYKIDECGNREPVVVFEKHQVKVKTKYLLRYMCARQFLFIQFVDLRVSTPGHMPFHTDPMGDDSDAGPNYIFDRWYQGNETENYLLSMIYARSYVEPGPIEDCGLWPYDEDEEQYPEFIINGLPDGSFERFTCEESKLTTRWCAGSTGLATSWGRCAPDAGSEGHAAARGTGPATA